MNAWVNGWKIKLMNKKVNERMSELLKIELIKNRINKWIN